MDSTAIHQLSSALTNAHLCSLLYTSDQKIYELCSNEETRELRAVQNRAFIQVPFSASTFGVRIGSLSYNLAEAFAALIRGEALPTLQFTETSIADDGTSSSLQALSKSGARVFEQVSRS